jgi:hypothetical protein
MLGIKKQQTPFTFLLAMKHIALLCSIVLFFSAQALAQQGQPFYDQGEGQFYITTNDSSTASPPLYILKNKRASYEMDSAQLKHLDPNTITSIEVIKGDGAVSGWGRRGEHGVVVIHVDRASFRKFLERQVEE